jgi:hypothetical protein
VVKRVELIREIRLAAQAQGLAFELERRHGPHDVYRLDGLIIPIPRHREIGAKVSFEIRKECEPKLGRRWWR